MKLRIAFLVIAIILGALAVVGVKGYINSIETSMEKEVEKVEVLVAAQNITEEITVETLISENMVETKSIPRKYLAEGVLASLDGYEGYMVAAAINKGEQITAAKFIKPEEIELVFIVPEGMVAISIPVDEIIGVSNLINIGDRVNVIATFFPEEKEAAPTEEVTPVESEESEVIGVTPAETEGVSIKVEKVITKTLLWNVEVLYVGTRIINPDKTETRSTETKMITLAVTPEDSEKLVFTEKMGSVWLALVPAEEIEKEETPGRTMDNIFKK
ncbi:MAG: Flp pilus assembly protein CpaB [Chloroflexi bacterium]|nr:Flp pilus assembly protein CpaB [Chloroflexota bacterium]